MERIKHSVHILAAEGWERGTADFVRLLYQSGCMTVSITRVPGRAGRQTPQYLGWERGRGGATGEKGFWLTAVLGARCWEVNGSVAKKGNWDWGVGFLLFYAKSPKEKKASKEQPACPSLPCT